MEVDTSEEMMTVYLVARSHVASVVYLTADNPLWGDQSDALQWLTKGRAEIAAERHGGYVVEHRVPA